MGIKDYAFINNHWLNDVVILHSKVIKNIKKNIYCNTNSTLTCYFETLQRLSTQARFSSHSLQDASCWLPLPPIQSGSPEVFLKSSIRPPPPIVMLSLHAQNWKIGSVGQFSFVCVCVWFFLHTHTQTCFLRNRGRSYCPLLFVL